MLLFAALFAASCAPATYTLTFVTNGAEAIAPITAEAGESITPPADPVRSDAEFEGWYTDADFSGEAVEIPTIMPAENITYYAKFSEAQTATLTLDAGEYGTLEETSYALEVGANVLTFIQSNNISPVPQSGLTFGGWYIGSTILGAGISMPSAGLTLTARYTVPYTVEVLTQNTAGGGTDPASDYKVKEDAGVAGGTGFVGDTVDLSASVSLTGYTLNRANSKAIVLGADSAQNVYRAYFDYREVRIRYIDNKPSDVDAIGGSAMPEDQALYYQQTGKLAPVTWSAEGYRFAGWATSANGAVAYADEDDYTMTSGNVSTVTLYARWNRAVTDSNGGSDVIYFPLEENGVALLVRDGMAEKEGTYDANTRYFSFTFGDETLKGRVSVSDPNAPAATDATFAYTYGDIALEYQLVDRNENAIVDGVTLKLDGTDRAEYKTADGTVEGTYVATGSGDYTFTPDDYDEDDENSPQPFDFALGTYTAEEGAEAVDIFVISDIYSNYYYYYDGMTGNYGYPYAFLDGYGSVTFILDGTLSNFIYGTYTVDDEELSILTFTDESGSLPVQLRYMQTQEGSYAPVYILQDGVEGEYTFTTDEEGAAGEWSVTLDGFGTMKYTFKPTGGAEQTGSTAYRYSGYYETDGDTAEEPVVNNVFYFEYKNTVDESFVFTVRCTPEQKAAVVIGNEIGNYTQYNSTTGLSLQFFLRGDGTAILSLVFNDGSYADAMEGTYTVAEDDGDVFVFTGTYIESEAAAPYKETLEKYYANFRFCLASLSSGSNAFIMDDGFGGRTFDYTIGGTAYSFAPDGFGQAVVHNVSTAADTDVSYTIMTGYGTGEEAVAFFAYSDGSNVRILKVSVEQPAGEKDTAELVEDEGENYYFYAAGTYTDTLGRIGADNEQLLLFPDGHAIVSVDGAAVAEGSYVMTSGEEDPFVVYTFTADKAPEGDNACYASFSFAYSSSGTFFPYVEGEAATLTLYGGTLELTGYGMAFYTAEGSTSEQQYQYAFSEEGDQLLLITQNGYLLVHLDDDGAIVDPGDEMGTYIDSSLDSQAASYYVMELDGYGTATLYEQKLADGAADGDPAVVATGTYEYREETDDYTVTWAEEAAPGFTTFAVGHMSYGTGVVTVFVKPTVEAKSYTITGGGSLANDVYDRVTYTDAEGTKYTSAAYGTTEVGEKTYLILSVQMQEEGESVTKTFTYLVDGTSLTAVSLTVGEFALFEDGELDTATTLILDGQGGAAIVTSEGETQGTYAAGEGESVFTFTPEDGSPFTFLLVTIASGEERVNAYIVYQAEWDRSIVNERGEVLTLDGYMTASYTDFYGRVYECSYTYLIVEGKTYIYVYGTNINAYFTVSGEGDDMTFTETEAPELPDEGGEDAGASEGSQDEGTDETV